MDIYYLDLKEPSLDVRIACDIRDVMVEEKGKPRTLSTLGEAMLTLLFVRYYTTQNFRPDWPVRSSMLRPGNDEPHDDLFRKFQLVPKPLSFWVNTLINPRIDARRLADAQYINDRRLRLFRDTIHDIPV